MKISLSKLIFCGTFIILAVTGITGVVSAQVKALPDTSKMKYNELSNSFKLSVFPSKNQSQKQQKKDEFDCYKWAAESSGLDPMNFPVAKAAPVEAGPDGGAVRGAARGAVAGVAIGAIAGDAGKGAAIGATAGGLKGAAGRGARQQQQQQQADAQANQTNQANANKYLKAFSACMEGKGYSVK
jgi:hypothetical protein